MSAPGQLDVRHLRSHDGLVCCEIAAPPIPPRLRPLVRSWLGYSEVGPPAQRRELPGPSAVVIFELGPSIRVADRRPGADWSRYPGGFVAGLDDGFSLTEHDGHQAGIQVDLTPFGARVLFGLRLGAIARRVTALTDLLPHHREVAERLEGASSWAERFALVEATLVARLDAGIRSSVAAVWATRRIEQAGGRLDIGGLASALGYSRKHLAALFDEHVGMTPKLYASIVRFDCVVDRLKTGTARTWADLAFAHGYADQAHLAREMRRFSGVTPTELRALFARELPGLFA